MNISYIAGFTDGEGYMGIIGRGPRISWGQNHKDVLDKIALYLQELKFHVYKYKQPPRPPKQPNTIHVLNMNRRDDCERLIKLLLPELIVKQQNAIKVLRWLTEHPRKHNTSEINIEQFLSLVSQGFTLVAISKQLRCCRGKVDRFAKQHGIHCRSGGRVLANGIRLPAMTRAERLAHRKPKDKNRKCADCNTIIYNHSQRCKSCAQKHLHRLKLESSKMLSTTYARSAASR